MATVALPTPLRPYAESQAKVAIDGKTVGEALEALVGKFPKLKTHLFAEEGKLRSFVNVYLNDEDVRYLEKLNTALGSDDTLTIVPSIAGGVL